MSIEQTIEFFNGLKCCTPYAEDARNVAIGIMHKHQEIQEIVTEWQKQNDPKIRFVASNSSMKKITEVLDGNNKKTKSSDEP